MNEIGKDANITAENFEAIVPTLILTNPRNYRIPNSKTESHMLPIQSKDGGKVYFTSAQFAAPGIYVQNQSPKQPSSQHPSQSSGVPVTATVDEQKTNTDEPCLMVTEDLAGGVFSPFYEKMMDVLYPQMLRQIKKFADVEATHNRSLTPFMQKLLTDDVSGRKVHVRPFWTDKDVAYIKMMRDALIYSRPQKETLIESSTVSLRNQYGRLPRRGRYQIRAQLRYLYLGPSQNVMQVHLNMKIDQIFFEPDEITAPTEPVMDLDSFFEPPPRPLTGDEILAKAIEAAGLPPAPRAPQKPPKRKPPQVPGKPAAYKQQILEQTAATKKATPNKKAKKHRTPVEDDDDSIEFLDMM